MFNFIKTRLKTDEASLQTLQAISGQLRSHTFALDNLTARVEHLTELVEYFKQLTYYMNPDLYPTDAKAVTELEKMNKDD